MANSQYYRAEGCIRQDVHTMKHGRETKDPAPHGTGSVVVAGTGFEPATSGQWLSVLYLLVSLHMLHLLYGLGGFGLVRELAPSRALILGGYGQGSHFDEVGTGRVGGCSGSVGAVSASGWPQ